MSEKQIVRVLAAVNAGCRTSRDVADYCGLSVAVASAYLSDLANDGLIRRVDRRTVRYARAGARSNVYMPVVSA